VALTSGGIFNHMIS